ncbi:MAG: hypothetical protein ACRDQA_01550, partial [Nocardioidaceae bacterium]
RDQWGAPGTDEVPVHYRAQALWQCDIFGFERTFVPVVFGFDYAEYVIEWDEADALLMRQAAEEFLTSVRQDRQPDVDAHVATTRRLRLLHPELDDVETEVDPRVVEQYRVARRLRDRASDRLRLAENRLRGQMGDAHTAVVDGHKVGSRSLSDIKERTQTVRAHRQDRLYIKEPK